MMAVLEVKPAGACRYDMVARGLRRCFGLRTAVCTAFADNDVGRLMEDFTACLGFEVEGVDEHLGHLEILDRVGGGDSFASELISENGVNGFLNDTVPEAGAPRESNRLN